MLPNRKCRGQPHLRLSIEAVERPGVRLIILGKFTDFMVLRRKEKLCCVDYKHVELTTPTPSINKTTHLVSSIMHWSSYWSLWVSLPASLMFLHENKLLDVLSKRDHDEHVK